MTYGSTPPNATAKEKAGPRNTSLRSQETEASLTPSLVLCAITIRKEIKTAQVQTRPQQYHDYKVKKKANVLPGTPAFGS